MPRTRLRFLGLLTLALGSLAATTLATTPASSQGSYLGQRATQDRDYSRMQSATQRAYGKTEKVTLNGKKKKRHKHKRKHRH